MATSNSKPISKELAGLLSNFEAWLYTHVRLANSTAALYLGFVRRAYPILGADPSHEKILEYIVSLRRSDAAPNSVCATCTALERFSAFLGRPIQLVRPPKIKKTVPHTLSEAEVAVFLHSARDLRQKAILSLMCYSGMRNKELCNLMVRDVDIPNNLIRIEVAKFGKERTVNMGGASAILVEYMMGRNQNPKDFLFVTARNGLQLEQQDIRKMVRVTAKRAGFDRRIWPHLFRHSLATNLLDRGAHLLTVKEQLGHSYVESTMAYIHRSVKRHQSDYNQHVPSYT